MNPLRTTHGPARGFCYFIRFWKSDILRMRGIHRGRILADLRRLCLSSEKNLLCVSLSDFFQRSVAAVPCNLHSVFLPREIPNYRDRNCSYSTRACFRLWKLLLPLILFFRSKYISYLFSSIRFNNFLLFCYSRYNMHYILQ